MKIPILFLALFAIGKARSQSITIDNPQDAEKARVASQIVKRYEPEIYEAIVQHCFIQRFSHPESPFWSTCDYDLSNRSLWILLATDELRQRSQYRIAGTIYHEALHLYFELQRERNGQPVDFSNLSGNEKKQEEIFIYKKTRELLTKIGTPLWEIQEYDQWVKGAETRNYF